MCANGLADKALTILCDCPQLTLQVIGPWDSEPKYIYTKKEKKEKIKQSIAVAHCVSLILVTIKIFMFLQISSKWDIFDLWASRGLLGKIRAFFWSPNLKKSKKAINGVSLFKRHPSLKAVQDYDLLLWTYVCTSVRMSWSARPFSLFNSRISAENTH